MRLLLIICAVAVVGTIVCGLIRSQLLLNNSHRLIEAASSYPTDYTIGSSAAPPLVITILGDSTAVGVGSGKFEDSYAYGLAESLVKPERAVRVKVLAKSGTRLSDLLNQQLPQLEATKPDLVIISIGANDATHFTDSSEYTANLKKSVTALAELDQPTLWGNTPDISYIPALPHLITVVMGKRARTQNEALATITKPDTIHVVDLYTQAVLDSSKDPGLYASDQFHPSASGYRLWTSAFERQLISIKLPN